MISIVVPAYNEELVVEKTVFTINEIMTNADIPYELILVDDGSKDSTWEKIQNASLSNPKVRGIYFSRNFGKESAIMAGLRFSKGDCCVVIDCDLQHPPEKIVEMYELWKEGYEIVEGYKSDRGKENKIYNIAAKMFYSIISAAVGFDMENSSDFKLLDRKVVTVLVNMREKNAFFRALSSWVGFKTISIPFDVRERELGETKWSFWSLMKYAVTNISSFSTAPMQIVTVLGIMMLIVSAVLGGISLYQKISGLAIEGFTTVILILLFSSSIMMISLGIIGYYIARIFEEIKDRPRYIVANTCGEGYETVNNEDF